jgi:adenylyltransferase/sulfurtransferase
MSELPLEIDCQTVSVRLENEPGYVLLDCREPEEHQLARIDGARLLPMSQIAGRLAELVGFESVAIAVHCHHGGRSLRVAQWLRAQGFVHAQSMAGGIDRWSLEIDARVPRY